MSDDAPSPAPTAFDAWVEPARPRAQVWRLIVGLIIVLAVWIVWQIAVIVGWLFFRAIAAGATWSGPEQDLESLVTGADPAATLVLLASFAGVWPGVMLAARVMHRLPLKAVFSWRRRLNMREFAIGAAIAVGYLALSGLSSFLVGGPPLRTTMDLGDWLVLLAPMVALLLVQTGAEELLFRGYMTQQLAARFKSPAVWAATPALLFGLVHFANGAGVSAAYGAFYSGATFLIALTCAALVWRTGGISAAMGLHFANNLGALTLLGAEGDMSSTQLWVWRTETAVRSSPVELALLVLMLVFILSPIAPFRRRGGPVEPAAAPGVGTPLEPDR